MGNIIKKMYDFSLFVQIWLLIFFIILNYDSLSEIEYILTINEIEYSIEINFYAVFGVMALIFVIVIVSSIQAIGSGLNEEGTKSIKQYIGILSIIVILNLSTLYFLLFLDVIGVILVLLINVIYLMHFLTINSNNGSE